MIRTGIVYKITNTVNGKVYIGQTIQSLKLRGQAHLSCAKTGRSDCKKLYAAINKYGKDAFEKEILGSGTGEQEKVKRCMDAMEIAYIKYFDSIDKGYNITAGGGGHLSKNPKTPEEKIQMARARRLRGNKSHKDYVNSYAKKGRDSKKQLKTI